MTGNISRTNDLLFEVFIIVKKVSFKPLWKLLIDLDMTNNDLIKKANIGKSTFYKLKQNKNVNTDSLIKICEALDCNISDIMTCKEEMRKKNGNKRT